MATDAERIAALEAEVARLRELAGPAGAALEAAWRAGYTTGRESITGPCPAAASQPRPRHLQAVRSEL